jgi:hypothetical protein
VGPYPISANDSSTNATTTEWRRVASDKKCVYLSESGNITPGSDEGWTSYSRLFVLLSYKIILLPFILFFFLLLKRKRKRKRHTMLSHVFPDESKSTIIFFCLIKNPSK